MVVYDDICDQCEEWMQPYLDRELDESERAIPATFQTRSQAKWTSPMTGTAVKQGPQGVVLGVKPGRYVLRAVSPAEQVADAKVDVTAGQATALYSQAPGQKKPATATDTANSAFDSSAAHQPSASTQCHARRRELATR